MRHRLTTMVSDIDRDKARDHSVVLEPVAGNNGERDQERDQLRADSVTEQRERLPKADAGSSKGLFRNQSARAPQCSSDRMR